MPTFFQILSPQVQSGHVQGVPWANPAWKSSNVNITYRLFRQANGIGLGDRDCITEQDDKHGRIETYLCLDGCWFRKSSLQDLAKDVVGERSLSESRLSRLSEQSLEEDELSIT